MSVVSGKRSEGDLTVITKANALLAYTIQICSNETNFPKRYRWCLTGKIIDTSTDIASKLIQANAVRVESSEDYTRRLTYQKEALELTYVLLNLIDAAYQVFSLRSSRVEHWTGLIVDLQRLIRGWHKKDKERYKDFG